MGPVCLRKGVKDAPLLSPSVPPSVGLKFLPASPASTLEGCYYHFTSKHPRPHGAPCVGLGVSEGLCAGGGV